VKFLAGTFIESPGFNSRKEGGGRKKYKFEEDPQNAIKPYWNPRLDCWWSYEKLTGAYSNLNLDPGEQKKFKYLNNVLKEKFEAGYILRGCIVTLLSNQQRRSKDGKANVEDLSWERIEDLSDEEKVQLSTGGKV
jgi:hypothetical protein